MPLRDFCYGPRGYRATLPRTASERQRYLRDTAVLPLVGLPIIIALALLHARGWAVSAVVASTIGTTLSRLSVFWRCRPRHTRPEA